MIQHFLHLGIVCLFVSILTGCGQSGPLVLPNEPNEVEKIHAK